MAAEQMSIDEEIAADWKAIQAKHAAPEDDELDKTAKDEPKSVEKPSTDDKARDESGKFTKQAKEPVVEGEPSQPTTPTEASAPQAPAPEPTTETTRDINRAPSSWKPAAKSAWANLPPEIRQEVYRRETDFLKGQSGLIPDATFGKSMRQVIDPYKMLIDAEGGTPERAVADVMRTASILRMGTPEQKTQAILAVCQQFGIPLSNLLPRDGQQQQVQPQFDPSQFRDPRFDQFMAHQQQQERVQVETATERWSNAVDASGKPLHPYVDNVMTEMSALVPQIKSANPSMSNEDVLQTAYDQATWANPEVRSVLIKEQQEQLEVKRRTDNQERVNLARKASSVNVQRRGSIPAPAKPGTMDETILETARELGMITT